MVGFVAAAILLAALTLTYSQTRLGASASWSGSGSACGFALAAALGVAAVCFAFVVGGPEADEVSVDKDRTDAETSSGRTNLISGIELFQDAPIAGQGSGRLRPRTGARWTRCASGCAHTERPSLLAEQGIIGLIPYRRWLPLRRLRPVPPWPSRNNIRAGVAAAFAALFVHTIGYAGFSIDPAMWALLALAFAFRGMT